MDYQDYITIDPVRRSGKSCVVGMRITVCDVLDYLAGDMTVEEILADFPQLKPEHMRACLAFAADQRFVPRLVQANVPNADLDGRRSPRAPLRKASGSRLNEF